jgi:hypothetical protein
MADAPAQAASTNGFWGLILRIAAAIGTGVGVLGFVAFFGGVVLWTRFTEVGIPADEAVAHVPRENLIATGAVFLVPALLTALAAVTVVVVLYYASIFSKVAEEAGRFRTASAEADRVAKERAADEEAARVELASAEKRADDAHAAFRAAEGPEAETFLEQRRTAAEGALRDAKSALREAAQALAEAEKQQQQKRLNLETAGQLSPEDARKRRYLVVGALLVGELVIAWPGLDTLTAWGLLVVFITGVLAISASFVVLGSTQKFTWFALSAFVAVGFFVAIVTYYRTKEATKASPVALLHDGNVPAYGFFVTETSNRVYIAQPQRKPETSTFELSDADNRLLEFPRDKVTNLEIGPLIGADSAYRRALELAVGICATRIQTAQGSTAASRRGKRRKSARRRTPLNPAASPCPTGHLNLLKSELKVVSRLSSAGS